MISSAIFFSLMSVLVRIAAEKYGISAWKTSEIRFVMGIVIILVLSIWMRDPLRFVNRPWLLSRGLFGGAAVCIYFYAITQIGIAKATIYTYTYPIWAGLLSPFLLKDQIRPGVWMAILAAFGGLYLIIVPSQGLGATSWLDLLALSGGILSGWAILSVKKLHETDTSRAILFSQCFFGLIIVVAPAQVEGYSFPPVSWLTLLAIGIVATIAQLQMTYAYKFINATEGSLLSMLNPVINVLLGMIFFHEPLTLRSILGCTIILISCTYAAMFQHATEDVRR
ncbi:EamA domain-containing membrane protein RarD [Syntrophus gentianae]|uniref:EamA domain-containing membrane protein RarD n=2 Tax=Syntrophus gentianae TaxID=43775 RepID=A0A1H8BJ83_9BACT|nr:EamA domain-containing membrane protein RarD [Syntrophus gentianae]